MKKHMLLSALILSNGLYAADSAVQSQGKIVLDVSGFHNDSGTMRVALFSSKKGYPMKIENAIVMQAGQIHNGIAHVEFDHIAYGEYAISVLHDENDNKKVDTNWIGFPIEGVAASNNIKPKFGPPSFKAARFTVSDKPVNMDLSMIYF